MSDSILRRGLALWFAGFVVLALFGGSVLGLAFLGVERSGEATGDLDVSNRDDANHTVRVEIVAANDSDGSVGFERAVTLEADESVSFDTAAEAGETYRVLVTVDGREPESFETTWRGDHCTTVVYVESAATVGTVMACA